MESIGRGNGRTTACVPAWRCQTKEGLLLCAFGAQRDHVKNSGTYFFFRIPAQFGALGVTRSDFLCVAIINIHRNLPVTINGPSPGRVQVNLLSSRWGCLAESL